MSDMERTYVDDSLTVYPDLANIYIFSKQLSAAEVDDIATPPEETSLLFHEWLQSHDIPAVNIKGNWYHLNLRCRIFIG